VGCVLVKNRRILSTGYNGFPQNISDQHLFTGDREYKLAVTIHAEANAILNAAKNGASTDGSTAYVTFPPCSNCASALIQAGVAEVICPHPDQAPERWMKSFSLGSQLLYEAGVQTLYYEDSSLWTHDNAPSAGPSGLEANSTGPPEKPEKTSTYTL